MTRITFDVVSAFGRLQARGLPGPVVVGILAGGLIVIDPEFMAQTINRPDARLNNYLDIAWLSAAMGVVAGALGSSFDSDIDVRNLTHSQRLRARVHTVDTDGTDSDETDID